MESKTAIIVYESIEKDDHQTLEHDLITWLMTSHPGVPHFHIDSISASKNTQLVGELIRHTHSWILVTLFDKARETSGLAGILNKARVAPHPTILSIGMPELLQNAQSLMQVRQVRDYQELRTTLDKEIRSA